MPADFTNNAAKVVADGGPILGFPSKGNNVHVGGGGGGWCLGRTGTRLPQIPCWTWTMYCVLGFHLFCLKKMAWHYEVSVTLRYVSDCSK